MDAATWTDQMTAVVDSARLLSTFDVIDVSFVNGAKREVYVAMDSRQRARGLSDIAFLDLDGMLFYYEQPSYVPFTMKSMLIPLDIAWYDQKGTLLKLARFEAGHQHPIFCSQPFSYVLEAPAGTVPVSDLRVRSYG